MGVPLLACQIPPLWSLTLNSKLWGFANNAVIAVRAEGGTVFMHINTISSQIILFLLLSLSLWRAHDVSRWQSEFPWNCCSQETRSRSQTTMWVQFCSAHTGGLFFVFSLIWKIQFPWTEDCVAANHSSGWPVEAVDSHASPSALSHKATSSHCRVRSFNRRRQKLALQLLLKMFFVFLFVFFCRRPRARKWYWFSICVTLEWLLNWMSAFPPGQPSANHVNTELHSTVLLFAFLYVLLAQKPPG